MHGIPPSRLRVIWNGTDAPTADIAPEVTAQLPATGIPVLASISTLIPQKGLPDLLDAVAMLRQQGRQFALLVVGQGKLRAELEAQAERLGLKDMVRFLGWVQAASRRALPACDIFVQSSHWEAMSVVVLEAMAAGKAVVVTSVGENARVVVPGECGLVVAPGDPSALAAALARLLDDPALRHRLGSAAKQRFDKLFTVQHMIRNYEHLYAEVLGQTAPAPVAETA
jgi:glycosyltransferase involved in cell wall biosynthesis